MPMTKPSKPFPKIIKPTTNRASTSHSTVKPQLVLGPPPLIPGDVDLTDFDFMPLDVRRLLQSGFWIKAMMTDPRVAAVSVNLWAVAWHRTPASSLPNDDAVLARYAMVDLSTWFDIRDAVMEPWVLCSDNRWYHPVVAEKAGESWQKMRGRDAKAAAFSKRQSLRASKRWNRDKPTELHAGRIASRNANIMEGDIEGENDTENLPSSNELSGDADAAWPSSQPARRAYPAEFEAWWKRYPLKKRKEQAYRAFVAVRRKLGIDGLHNALDNYLAYKKANCPDTPFPWPTTWLIDRRWEDGT